MEIEVTDQLELSFGKDRGIERKKKVSSRLLLSTGPLALIVLVETALAVNKLGLLGSVGRLLCTN